MDEASSMRSERTITEGEESSPHRVAAPMFVVTAWSGVRWWQNFATQHLNNKYNQHSFNEKLHGNHGVG